jgi:hypothetical protein
MATHGGRDAMHVELTAQSKVVLGKMTNADAMPDLRKALMQATAPAQAALRRAARALPSTRKRKDVDSLRNALAGAIQRRIKVSAKTITVLILSVPRGGKSNIARAVEGIIPWEHSTFGHSDRKVTQKPMPYFYKTMDELTPAVGARIEAVMTDFVDKKL